MTDQTSIHQTTKSGTDNNLQKAKGPKVPTPEDLTKKLALAGVKDEEEGVIADLAKFNSALNLAKLKGSESLEVTKEIFDYLANNQATPFIMYQGIRVYEHGTKQEIERRERLSMDALAKIKSDEWRAANPDKCL